MSETKILFGYSNYSDTKLVEVGGGIKQAMKGNAYFPLLQDNVKEYTKVYDTFVASIPSRNFRSPATVAIKDANREICIASMKSLGYLIMAQEAGNKPVLDSTGFPTSTAQRSKKPIPATPLGVQALITNKPNELLVSCNADKNADIYEARVSTDEAKWEWTKVGTASKLTVVNIPLGVQVYVQMRCENATGESGWSNSVVTRLPLPTEPKVRYAND